MPQKKKQAYFSRSLQRQLGNILVVFLRGYFVVMIKARSPSSTWMSCGGVPWIRCTTVKAPASAVAMIIVVGAQRAVDPDKTPPHPFQASTFLLVCKPRPPQYSTTANLGGREPVLRWRTSFTTASCSGLISSLIVIFPQTSRWGPRDGITYGALRSAPL